MVDVRFVIARDGVVANAVAHADVAGAQELERCVQRAVLGLAFPQPDAGPWHVGARLRAR